MSDISRQPVPALATDQDRVASSAQSPREPEAWVTEYLKSLPAPLPQDLRSRYDYAAMKDCDQLAVAFVKLGDRENSISASLDGSRSSLITLSRKPRFAEVQPESDGNFLIVVMTRAYYRTIFDLGPRATIFFTDRPLSADQEWSDTDRERWDLINRHARRINSGISRGGRSARAGYPGDSQ